MVTPVFIVGCGDVGQRVAKLWQAKGAKVSALARSSATVARLRANGIEAVPGDLDQPQSLVGLSLRRSVVYYFAPPPGEGVDDPRMRGFLAAMKADHPPLKIVYISTTGVYGDCHGAWITEAQPVNPRNDRSRRRLAAERALGHWSEAAGVPQVILRVGGIYGPGRLPLDRIRRGAPVLREQDAPPSNRIHVDDLAAVCVAAAEKSPGGIYNVADGNPTTMTDYFNRVAEIAGLPRPPALPFESARHAMTPAMLSFLDESKRIDNRKMREELGVTLRYPSLAQGLPACLPHSP